MFNARRGGEPSHLKITDWLDRKKWISNKVIETLDDLEKRVFEKMEVMYQSGKGNHLLPCLVPKDCVKAVNILCNPATRKNSNIFKENCYLFPTTKTVNMHVLGWSCTKFMCAEAKVTNPLINATNQRGRISTLYASLDVPLDERDYFYKHMGHSRVVNLGTCQRPLPVQ